MEGEKKEAAGADAGKGGKKGGGGREDIGRSEPHCRITRAGSCPREHKTTDAGCWPRGKFMTRLYAEIETWSASFTRVQIEHADFPPEKFLKIFSSKGDPASFVSPSSSFNVPACRVKFLGGCTPSYTPNS